MKPEKQWFFINDAAIKISIYKASLLTVHKKLNKCLIDIEMNNYLWCSLSLQLPRHLKLPLFITNTSGSSHLARILLTDV